MRNVTLCFLKNDTHLCIALKKRGFGTGKWNGVGGKVEEGERIEEAALRELFEEIGVKTQEEHLKPAGSLKFYFNDKPEWNQHMHIFFIEKWEGEPVESDEVAPEWHHVDALPFDDMWEDDKHWLPVALAGHKVGGEFYFDDEGKTLTTFTLEKQ